jgi:hypothetical protein
MKINGSYTTGLYNIGGTTAALIGKERMPMLTSTIEYT